jgi:hypothetical protein
VREAIAILEQQEKENQKKALFPFFVNSKSASILKEKKQNKNKGRQLLATDLQTR